MKQKTPLVKMEMIAKKIIEFVGYLVILMSLIVIVVGAIRKEIYLLGGTVTLLAGIAIVFLARIISIVRKQ